MEEKTSLWDLFGPEPTPPKRIYYVEKPDVLDDGVYDFSVNDIKPDHYSGSVNTRECESFLTYLNVEGFPICERFCMLPDRMNKPSAFLVSVGIKKKFDDFTDSDFYKAIGKTGRCFITNYETEDGSIKNCVKYYIGPKEDIRLIEWREAVKRNAGYRCEKCGATEHLHAHHKHPADEFPDEMYDIRNGECLCRECHRKIHLPRFQRREF